MLARGQLELENLFDGRESLRHGSPLHALHGLSLQGRPASGTHPSKPPADQLGADRADVEAHPAQRLLRNVPEEAAGNMLLQMGAQAGGGRPSRSANLVAARATGNGAVLSRRVPSWLLLRMLSVMLLLTPRKRSAGRRRRRNRRSGHRGGSSPRRGIGGTRSAAAATLSAGSAPSPAPLARDLPVRMDPPQDTVGATAAFPPGQIYESVPYSELQRDIIQRIASG